MRRSEPRPGLLKMRPISSRRWQVAPRWKPTSSRAALNFGSSTIRRLFVVSRKLPPTSNSLSPSMTRGLMAESFHEDRVALGLFGERIEVSCFSLGVVTLPEYSHAHEAGQVRSDEGNISCTPSHRSCLENRP